MLCIAALAIASFFSVPEPARAQPTETCDQCKYLRCLKSTVKRKKALMSAYQDLYNVWSGRLGGDAGHAPTERDVGALSEPQRTRAYVKARQQLDEYYQMEDTETDAVPAAEDCNYPNKVMTNPSTGDEACVTQDLLEWQSAQPCKELADLLKKHEDVHVDACNKRRQPLSEIWVVPGTGDIAHPPKIVTPVGKAAEEIRAYQLEIDALNAIIKKLEKRCGHAFKDVTVDCVMPAGRYKVRMGQKLEGYACGDPTQSAWTITPKYFVEGMPGMPPLPDKNNKPFTTDCLPAGSDLERQRAEILRSHPQQGGGWMCVYHEGDPPKISIRYFRITRCEGPIEQTFTVEAEPSEKCDESQAPAAPPPPASPPSVKPNS
jgi:hypothetical protein